MTWATRTSLGDCTVTRLNKTGLCKWEIISKNTVIRMAEENTEFEKAHDKAVTNFSHVFFPKTLCLFCIIQNWWVVNNPYFPKEKRWKRHLVKTEKVCGLKSTAATQLLHTSSGTRILEPVSLFGLTLNSGRGLIFVHVDWVFSLPIDFVS